MSGCVHNNNKLEIFLNFEISRTKKMLVLNWITQTWIKEIPFM
jgi:hypothetical protein